MAEKASVLIVGGGSIGERHARCFLATGRSTVSVCDISETIRSRLAKQYPLTATYDSLAAALAAQPTVVVVATPAHLHVSHARGALAAGSHVLIEKPLSISEQGLDELATEAASAKRCVGVAYVLRHHPGMQWLRQQLVQRQLGPPLQLVYVAGQDFPHFRPAYREIYYRDRATGGGAIQDALTHSLNAAEWLVGPTRRVAADAAHLHLEGVAVEDTVHVLSRMASERGDEVLASFSLNQHQAPNESTLSVVCRDGLLRWEMHASRCFSMRRGDAAWTVHDLPLQERDTGFISQAHSFLDAVEGKSPVMTSLAEARTTLRTALAILDAADHRRWVNVEPVA
ncbi:MAG: Gfo/Idh/MocA family oxidoreductase [Pirellulales bacterium]|nr:Gfo/Idh/MocA family oxidoreductase [Pirellulales bacterium]